MIPLSVLDIGWPGHMPRLVQLLDAAGYHRFWATEHHSVEQSASPILTAGLAAAMTERIRIGTAGVLLHYACPVKVAEDFRLLELYFPGRIDLGIAGARASKDQELYLDGRPAPTANTYSDRLRELVALVRGTHAVAIGPRSDTTPPLWLCGTSRASAELAGSLGMSFAFHRYLAGSSEAARDALAAYRASYISADGTPPYALIATYGACAETPDGAARQWASADAGNPCFVGTPTSCVDQLDALARTCDADELAINLLGTSIEARLDAYALLADAAALVPAIPQRQSA
jgi:luciferase family oxidoreductase group 1